MGQMQCLIFEVIIFIMGNYADDNLIIRYNTSIVLLVADMEKSLEEITKRLKKSGLQVNESKTELCLFHGNFHDNTTITANGITIHSE